MIKVTKKVIFGGLGGFTVYPGTICKIMSGNNNSHVIYAVPVSESIKRKCKKVSHISEPWLSFYSDECVIINN